MKQKTFNTTAILGDLGYKHFGIHETTANMYGHKIESIVNLIFKLHNEQNVVLGKNGELITDYWGWYDYKEKRFTMIYPKYFLLNMCFPNGIKTSEDFKEGKAYRLEFIN